MATPSAKDLKTEIETGPLAADLASLWRDVFPSEPEPDVNDMLAHDRWERIKARFGTLKPDAAWDIWRLLGDPTKRTRRIASITRGAFLATVATLVPELTNASQAVKDKWGLLLNLATGANDSIEIIRPELQALLDSAVADGIMTAQQRDGLRDGGEESCSRLAELGWSGITADSIVQAKAV